MFKQKDLVPTPWLVAMALQADGWVLRQDIIWHKPSPMPESVTDRCTKAHEYVFLMTKAARYYFDGEAVREDVKPNSGVNMRAPKCGDDRPNGTTNQTEKSYGRVCGANKRSVWTVATQPFPGAHFATFPPKLIEPMLMAGTPEHGRVLDPFAGAGTTGVVCRSMGLDFTGIELNPEYADMARKRIDSEDACLFGATK